MLGKQLPIIIYYGVYATSKNKICYSTVNLNKFINLLKQDFWMKNHFLKLSLLFFASSTSNIIQKTSAMEATEKQSIISPLKTNEQKNNNIHVKTLFDIVAQQIVSNLADNNGSLDILDQVPLEVTERLIHVTTHQGNTLAHSVCTRAVMYNLCDETEGKLAATELIVKLKLIISKGFVLETQNNEGETMVHLLARMPNREAINLLYEIKTKGFCMNIPAKTYNVLETAINARNITAVKMLTEETNTTLNLEEKAYPLITFIRLICSFKNKEPLFKYLYDNLIIYKQRSNNQHVLAPCCEKGHCPYYDHGMMVVNYSSDGNQPYTLQNALLNSN